MTVSATSRFQNVIKGIVRRFLILCALLSAASGCASTEAFDYGREPDPRREEFVIGVGDVVRINVWHMPDISGDAKVRPDGTVTMPLLGDMKAAGASPSALRAKIESALKSYIKDDSAKVTVAVLEVNSYHFTVAGNAERQAPSAPTILSLSPRPLHLPAVRADSRRSPTSCSSGNRRTSPAAFPSTWQPSTVASAPR